MKLIIRLLEAILYAINRINKKRAAGNPADTIANGGRVQHSDESFSDLADRADSDRTE